ncbi:ATP-binding protein [Actinacidiphila glaucinigra]|uniref:ATP-binding protein n=1 Tax=Actinacidiphila glaucinigra TaxID=235986 RepID=UPI0033A72A9B
MPLVFKIVQGRCGQSLEDPFPSLGDGTDLLPEFSYCRGADRRRSPPCGVARPSAVGCVPEAVAGGGHWARLSVRAGRRHRAVGCWSVATAILDRLLHHCDVISINGPSYRLKNRLAAIERDTQVA